MTEDHRIVKRLRGVAAKLSGDFDLQKDLMQEMLVHLVQAEAELPGHTSSWYIKCCEFRARNYLKRGRSVDSLKRRNNLVPLHPHDDSGHENRSVCPDAPDPIDLHGEIITRDIVSLLVPQLTEMERHILSFLMHGFGVREIARALCISHPKVIQHRKKIARSASTLLVDAGCVVEAAGGVNTL
jgi:DNA-directed RNA polymerase specialized sigma24 family protein